MITEQDLQEAIAECQGKKNPDASTCIKLAAFYTVKEHLFPKEFSDDNMLKYSFDARPVEKQIIKYTGESEFARAVNGKNVDDIMIVLDEVVSALSVLNPKLYASIIRKIEY